MSKRIDADKLEALAKYLRHNTECDKAAFNPGKCSCGMDDAYKALAAAAAEEGEPNLHTMMMSIASGHPLSMEYETDARVVWPARWQALMDQYGEAHPAKDEEGKL
jgi:hypothetical protein